MPVTSDKKTKEATPTVDRREHLSKLDSLRYPNAYRATPKQDIEYRPELYDQDIDEEKTEHSPQGRGREIKKKEGESMFNRIARSMSPGTFKNRPRANRPRRRSRSPRAGRPKTDRPKGGRRTQEKESSKDFLEAMDELGV
jgi:hypothetical protein